MSPIPTLAIIAAGLSQILAIGDIPQQSIPGILEGLSKLGVTGILIIAIWHLKKQCDLKDDANKKIQEAMELKDVEFKQYLMKQADGHSVLISQTRDVMQAVLAYLTGEAPIRNPRRQIES